MLSTQAATRKDKRTASNRGNRLDGTLQHRHFAVIASLLAEERQFMPGDRHDYMVERFAKALAGTNPNFDRQRFLRACGMEG